MISKKILAAVAALLLSVPAIAAADQIEVGPVTERLVEGHTVFTVLEQVTCEGDYCPPGGDPDKRTHAAAVAVLVRERTEYKDICPAPCADLFRGVLWFNDQYLVEPEYDTNSGQTNKADTIRYPCGGSVLAVNKGDPNPAFLLNAGIASVRYVESYRITDPNDHTWVIDKYLTIVGASTGHPDGHILGDAQNPPSSIAANVAYPVWVVNLFGGEVARPDTGLDADQCAPFVDGDNYTGTDCTTKASDGRLDESCYGPAGTEEFAHEPTDSTQNGGATYCYDGNAYTGTNAAGTGCTVTAADGTVSRDPNHPLRLYNAVLFFYLGPGDVKVAAETVRHDANNADTNGCQVGTEWACPTDANGAEDDDREGNSHPFNPVTSGQLHGDHDHATGLIDLYASNTRPVEPVLRNYVVDETVNNPNPGSRAPFHS